MFYKVVLEYGHLGAGKGFEVTRFVKGRDTLSVLSKAKAMPRVKGKKKCVGVKYLCEVTQEEYISGLRHFRRLLQGSPYFRFRKGGGR